MSSYAIFHPYLIYLSASTVSIAPVEVANVEVRGEGAPRII